MLSMSLGILSAVDYAVDEFLVFCHHCTICKKMLLSIGFFFHLRGWQPWYLFFCIMEILELLVENEVLLWKTRFLPSL